MVLGGGPAAVLSHRSAAGLWRLRTTDRIQVEITVPPRRASRAGLQLHSGSLAADEITTHQGIPITTPPRTLLDLAPVLTPHEEEPNRTSPAATSMTASSPSSTATASTGPP